MVRLGFEGEKMDPWMNEQYNELKKEMDKMATVKYEVQENGEYTEKVENNVQAIFECNLKTTENLGKILTSSDPMLVELFRGLNLAISMKFHNKQFRTVLQESFGKPWEHKIGEIPVIKREEEKEEVPEENSSDSESKEAENKDSEDEDSEDDEYEENQRDKKMEEEKEDKFSLKDAFTMLIPLFLFIS